jgi:hypothetical protein
MRNGGQVSARFPWILPAGTLKRDGAAAHLVDGGYFDNSGIETSRDFISCLRNVRCNDHFPIEEPRGNFEIYLISIKGTSDGPVTDYDAASEIMTPILSFLSSRKARGDLTVFRQLTGNAPSETGIGDPYDSLSPAILDHRDFELTLGFRFSDATEEIVASQIGNPEECGNLRGINLMSHNERFYRIWKYSDTNSCQMCKHASHPDQR